MSKFFSTKFRIVMHIAVARFETDMKFFDQEKTRKMISNLTGDISTYRFIIKSIRKYIVKNCLGMFSYSCWLVNIW